ncbi:unnamed protein product [Polarella glacialis]|uniref:RNA-editing substrate-binding complex 6 protein domain-containing protein n=1 Tax=Polarella glacialis TaxID=89957 RepID=A0A813IWC7_POLGL|nr:unnamed protein product [Polarella glacialis]CAE8656500.1 unnamed protein product [Polarella glacialis]
MRRFEAVVVQSSGPKLSRRFFFAVVIPPSVRQRSFTDVAWKSKHSDASEELAKKSARSAASDADALEEVWASPASIGKLGKAEVLRLASARRGCWSNGPKHQEHLKQLALAVGDGTEFEAGELARLTLFFSSSLRRSHPGPLACPPPVFEEELSERLKIACFTLAEATVRKSDQLSAEEFAFTASAFARARFTQGAERLAEITLDRLSSFAAVDISDLAWAFAKMRWQDTNILPLFGELARVASLQRFDSLSGQEISSTLWAFAKVSCCNSELFVILGHAAKAQIWNFNTQELANTAWALGAVAHFEANISDAVAEAIVQKISEMNPQGLANSVWAFAKAGTRRPNSKPGTQSPNLKTSKLFNSVAMAGVTCIGSFSSQEIANTLWAFAKIRRLNSLELGGSNFQTQKQQNQQQQNLQQHQQQEISPPVAPVALFLGCLGREAALRSCHRPVPPLRKNTTTTQQTTTTTINNNNNYRKNTPPHPGAVGALGAGAVGAKKIWPPFKSQELSNIAWACADLGMDDAELFDNVAEAAVHKINMFNAQEIANTALAFSSFSQRHPRLLNSLFKAAAQKCQHFTPQEMSNLALAFARADATDKCGLLVKLANASRARAELFSCQEFANTVWAFAKVLWNDDVGLFHKLAKPALTRIGSFNAQDTASTAWAFARVGCYDVEVFDLLATSAIRNMRGFKPQDVSNTAWAFATASMGAANAELFSKLSLAAVSGIRDFSPQALANTAWAFAEIRQPLR